MSIDVKKAWWFNIGSGFRPGFKDVLDFAAASPGTYTLPSLSQRILQNAYYIRLESIYGDNLVNTDAHYTFATDGNEEFSLLNWKNPAVRKATKVGGAVFTTNKGWKSAASGYLNLGFAPSGFTLASQNDVGLWLYSDDNINENSIPVGAADPSSNFYYNLAQTSALEIIRPNGNTSGTPGTLAYSKGFWSMVRTSSSVTKSYYNGGLSVNNTSGVTSTTPTAQHIYVCAYNNNGTAANFCTRNIGCLNIAPNFNSYEMEKSSYWNEYYTQL